MLCLKLAGWVANSVDQDETPHSAASHLGLSCLLRPVCPNTYGKYGIWVYKYTVWSSFSVPVLEVVAIYPDDYLLAPPCLSCRIMTIMILSLSEISLSQYCHYQGSTITMHHNTVTVSKPHSILMNFVDFIKPGPSCSKLTMSIVNDSLKFALSDTQICWNFLLKKCE